MEITLAQNRKAKKHMGKAKQNKQSKDFQTTAKPRTKILRLWGLSQEDIIYCAWTF